jgi:aspartyl-tRNA(Asn)/glutamyl-tRNA(Gln) amidotransferase subunit A
MTDNELKKLTLAGAIRLITEKQISSSELTAAVLRRIERLNPEMRAFISVIKAKGLTKQTPLLFGVPISVKDLFDTKGVRTTAGSKIFADRVPEQDATIVTKLKAAGAVIVGKTNMHEFAFGVTTVNPHFGAARNPWHREHITGGSSGGSGSAVALGMGFASVGSDTGGSIRIPASLCGVVGLKPTYGQISLHGVVPLAWSLDHPGPMTRTVEDAAILMETIAGHDPLDPFSRDINISRYTEALLGTVKGLRAGIPKTYFYENLDPVVGEIVQKAVRNLERLGMHVDSIEMPGVETHRAVWLQIATPEAYAYHEHRLQQHRNLYGADVLARLEPGRVLLSIDYVRAQRARTLLKEECKRVFDKVDVVVTPTLPIPAPRIEDVLKPWGRGPEPAVAALGRLTRYFNIVGLPAISVPCGFTPRGLPIGMQIVGKAFDETTVLRVAHAYEQDARWFERIPEI